MLAMVCIALVWGWLVGWVWPSPRTVREGLWIVMLTLAICGSMGWAANEWRATGLGRLWGAFAAACACSWLLAGAMKQHVRTRTLAASSNRRSL